MAGIPTTAQCGANRTDDEDTTSSSESEFSNSSSSSDSCSDEKHHRHHKKIKGGKGGKGGVRSRRGSALGAPRSATGARSDSDSDDGSSFGFGSPSSSSSGRRGASNDAVTQFKTRHMSLRIHGSPTEFAVGELEASSFLQDASAALFEGNSHVVEEVKLLGGKNNMSVTIHGTVNGLAPESAKVNASVASSVAAPSGTQGMFTLHPGEKVGEPITLYKAETNLIGDSFLSQYPKYAHRNFKKDLVFNHLDNSYLVPIDHPLIDMYRQHPKGRPLTRENQATQNTFQLDKDIVENMMSKLESRLFKSIPAVNLNNMSVSLSRAHGTVDPNTGAIPWDDATELLEGVKEAFHERQLNDGKSVMLKFAVKYKSIADSSAQAKGKSKA